MKTLLSAVALLFVSLWAKGQGNGWEWQNPKPQGNQILDLCFVDTQTGYAVAGGVLKTMNGGQSWALTQTSPLGYFNRCQFLDAETGWVSNTYSGKLAKTTDGGQTWIQQDIGSGLNEMYPYYLDAYNGWAVGNLGKVFKTSDGGTTWTPVTGVTTQNLKDVFFTDTQTGWMAGSSGTILKTTDAGASWIVQPTATSKTLNHITFVDALHGWAWNTDVLLRTTDGGSTWSNVILEPSLSLYPVRLYFSDAQNGWGSMKNGMFKTTDGGVTWTETGDLYGTELFYALDSNHGWLVQENWYPAIINKISRTSNGGNTWQVLDHGRRPYLNALHFTNNQTGWAVGEGLDTTNQHAGAILSTINGGTTWQTTSYGHNALIDVTFSGTQTGWIVGDSGTILKTTDGGTNWVSKPSGTLAQLRSVHFTNSLNGWAVGFQQNGGFLLHTTDGGETWQTQSPGPMGKLRDIFFSDTQHGWIVGESHLYTTDGGISWQPMNALSTVLSYSCVFFRNSLLGWVAGADATIAKTTDGGLTWQDTYWEGASDQWDIQFIDDLNGWTVGNGIFHTSDGGETWQRVASPAANLSAVFFLNNHEGWIAGMNAGILHTSTGGTTPTHKTLVSSPAFTLSPNPAEETFTVNTSGSICSLSITDAFGRLVKTVGASSLQGNILNIKDLMPGMYYVRVKMTEGINVQKLVKR